MIWNMSNLAVYIGTGNQFSTIMWNFSLEKLRASLWGILFPGVKSSLCAGANYSLANATLAIILAVLDKNGLIFGCFVTIDGQQYFCRSPQGGVFNGALNEWDCFLQALAHDEPEHPWFTANYCSKHGSFWCQETSGNWPRQKVVRAPTDVVKWKHMDTDFKSPIVGFLPILEPVEAVIPPEKLVGQRVKVYGKGASATGRLVSVDNYDLCLSSGTCSMPSQEWIDKKETNITISRDSVLWVRPV